MKLDDLLLDYFGTTDLQQATREELHTGIIRTIRDFESEQCSERRSRLWSLLYVLGRPPEPV